MEAADLKDRCGPWALVVGASDGLGAAFASALADAGLHLLLVARRQGALDDVAAGIRSRTDVEVRTHAVDLTEPDAAAVLADAAADLEIGLVIYVAGADPAFQRFLAQPVDDAVAMVQRNCVAPLRVCHHFAAPMQARGHGGIILVSSGAGLIGGPNMVAYGATKAFDMVMAEALWAELHGHGVDVLGLVLGKTDTPALRRLLLERGEIADLEAPLPDAAMTDEVVTRAFAALGDGPTCFATEDVRVGAELLGGMTRNDAARAMAAMSAQAMGDDPEPS